MCSSTPRFSYRPPETRVRAVGTRVSDVYGHGCTGGVWYQGRVYGWVPGRAIPVPSQHEDVPLLKRRPDSGAGPGSPIGAGVGGLAAAPPGRPAPTLRARSAHPWASLVPPRAIAASWPIRARYRLYFYKVSQNDRVSPKYVEKACHAPCFQNGLGKSPLDFLRFPILAAFSHKELMGCFDHEVRVHGQNDEVSPDVHTMVREGCADTPTVHASKLAPVDRSSSA